jgi:CBS domain-containing protein
MRQKPSYAEKLSPMQVTLEPTDTLLRALGVMDRYRVRLLPVLGATGRMVGLLSREHVMSAWEVDPLLPVSLVMAACEPPRPPGPRLVPR